LASNFRFDKEERDCSCLEIFNYKEVRIVNSMNESRNDKVRCEDIRQQLDHQFTLGIPLIKGNVEITNHLKSCKECHIAFEARKHVQQLLNGKLI
jgi:hypothetical protein